MRTGFERTSTRIRKLEERIQPNRCPNMDRLSVDEARELLSLLKLAHRPGPEGGADFALLSPTDGERAEQLLDKAYGREALNA